MSLKIKEIVEDSRKHVVALGRFKLSGIGEKTSYLANELLRNDLNIPFDLAYYRKTIVVGADETKYMSWAITPPSQVPDGKEAKSLALSENPKLVEALLTEGNVAEVGGELFVELLNALDILKSFWNPQKFDVPVLQACVSALDTKQWGDVLLESGGVREILLSEEVSSIFLAFIRSGDQESTSIVERLENAIKAVKINGSAVGEKTANAVFENIKEFRTNLRDPGGRVDVALKNKYKILRTAIAQVEKITSCEPLVALIVGGYLFSKVTDKSLSDEIRDELIEKVYKANGREMAALLSAGQYKEDQNLFSNSMEALKKEIGESGDEEDTSLSAEKMKEKKDLKKVQETVYQVIIADLDAHRWKNWTPSVSFTKDDLIKRNVNLIKMLAVHAIKEVAEIIGQQRDFLDMSLEPYKAFEAKYGDSLTLDELKESQLNLTGNLKVWFEGFLATAAKKDLKGTKLGDEFRKAFNTQLGTIVGEGVKNRLLDAGTEIVEKVQAVARVYENELSPFKGKEPAFLPSGGTRNLNMALNPKSAEETSIEEKQAVFLSAGGELQIPKDKEAVIKAELTKMGEEYDDIELVSVVPSPISDVSTDDQESYDLATIKINRFPKEGELDGELGTFVNQEVNSYFDQRAYIEEAKKLILKNIDNNDAGKAPARAQLRALLMGEAILGTPNELSALGKKDTSLGASVLLEMVEKLGAKAEYEGDNRELLKSTDADLECGIEDMRLDLIWGISKGAEGEKKLSELVRYWKSLANEVFEVGKYVQSTKNLEGLARAIGDANGVLTIVNSTLEEHVNSVNEDGNDQTLNQVDDTDEMPPPGFLYVSDQARPNLSAWKSFESAYENHSFNDIKTVSGLGKVATVPLAIFNNPLESDGWWPTVDLGWIRPEDKPLFLPFLMGTNFFNEEIGDNRYKQQKIGKKSQKNQVGKELFSNSKNGLELARSVISSYKLIERCKPDMVDEQTGSGWALISADSRIPDKLQYRSRDGSWTDVPQSGQVSTIAWNNREIKIEPQDSDLSQVLVLI